MIDTLRENVDISELSNFKTRAITRYFFEISCQNDVNKLGDIFDFIKEKNIDHLFIGGGTNLLFAFEKFNGLIIKNSLRGWDYNKETQILESYSSSVISNIAQELEDHHEQNLWHRFIGLPGSIGGAVFGNAGCFGLEIENNFINAEVFDLENGIIKLLSKNEMDFSYRNSILKTTGQYFLIKAYFDLSKKVEKYASNVDNIYFREHKQPKGNTCGSFFKNPSREYTAGRLIEESGLKGYKIGGAFFSELHANFLMSDDTASYKDLLSLIEYAQKIVKDKYNIILEPEVRIIRNK
ncbi:UDP-N-acetylmuramate dehydrogenase [Candidatus Gracilibacteria bacterium 28_42_T64]|nr:UDP-N-acetylmuramate dehydrogenase [Candidatus Gracilibacteria bacterium 28_42_T64]